MEKTEKELEIYGNLYQKPDMYIWKGYDDYSSRSPNKVIT